MIAARRMLRACSRLSRRIVAPLLLAAACVPASAWGQSNTLVQPRMLIYGGPMHREFLGCINCGLYDVHSVWNGYGPFGWDNDYRFASRFAIYWQPQGRYSACAPYAADPPILVDTSRHDYGRLNISVTRADSICGPHGISSICNSLKAMCRKNLEPPQ